MKKLYLVDVSSMFFRAFYAIPPLSNPDGMPTNALYGFLSMTIKLLRDIRPDYMAFCFDRKEPSFRSDLYPEYKANRSEMPEDLVPQVPYVRKLSELIGIPVLDKEGFEADDVIGTLTRLGREENLEVIIVSGDKDFAQLVGPFVSMYDTMKNIRYDEDGVVEKWGVSPDQIIDYLALVGDSSDNIPGVKGVGPKGAQKLLAEFKTLDGIYENLDKVSGKALKEKLTNNKDEAYLAKKLVTIVLDADGEWTLDQLKLKPIDKEGLRSTLMELGFKSFEKNLLGEASPESSGEDSSTGKVDKKSAGSKVTASSRAKSSSSTAIQSWVEKTWTLKDLESDVQAYGEVWTTISERGLLFGFNGRAGFVDGDLLEVGRVLSTKLVAWKGFDLKETFKALSVEEPVAKWDAMLAAYVAHAGNIEKFDEVYQKYTGKTVPDLASPDQIISCHAELEAPLRQKLEEMSGQGVLDALELPLVPILYAMETRGIGLDVDELAEQSKGLAKDIEKLEKSIHEEAGQHFNIASPKQLGEILFDKMGLPPSKKTKTGYSTASDVLSKLADEHPICSKVLEFRELAKLKSTYVDALPQLINKETGKIHTHFRQAATSTGRLSSVNPNLQNIPIRTERGRLVRKAFVAEKGHVFISADYSQIELRILAHITGDPGLVKAFNQDLDIHAATAAEIFGVPLNDVNPELRRRAKAVNFGIAYGQGAYGLADSLNIPRGEASDIIKRYFQRFAKVKQYMTDTVEFAKAQGYVETLFGRRRYIEELKSKRAQIRAFGERAAINAPIQGAASDLVKMAMIQIHQDIEVPMILQVHDELLFECPEAEAAEQAEEIKQVMESAAQLDVPLRVNVAWGKTWDDAH
ncbi:MAG: DNA polymerase I [Bdellovibrionaceae bacterium]|nr:DNA polymerase I [Bdellovibrionales bacterium]MCB9086138.1 DNA polymerase I [Pseudobdellovibrionaceae bacterium]